MEPVSTVPVAEGVLDLGQRYPDLAGRGPVLSEYGTLFALRRMLQESWEDGKPPADQQMIGIAHYRRFPVTQPIGRRSFVYGLVRPTDFPELQQDLFLPADGTLLLPAPANFGMPLVTQYGVAHHVRDLLQFMACAIDLGVVEEKAVAQFLGHTTMLVPPSIGIYPTEWLMDVLEKIERVVEAFEAGPAVEREGYQRRAVGFCCERLHAMLLAGLIPTWPQAKVSICPAVIVTDDDEYTDGG
jgi:hypothetical protein